VIGVRPHPFGCGGARQEQEARPDPADIQLADGSSGLDAVNELLRTFEVPVVFITAYSRTLLTGERPEPAFLISKPFQPRWSQPSRARRCSSSATPRTARPRRGGLASKKSLVVELIRRAFQRRRIFLVAGASRERHRSPNWDRAENTVGPTSGARSFGAHRAQDSRAGSRDESRAKAQRRNMMNRRTSAIVAVSLVCSALVAQPAKAQMLDMRSRRQPGSPAVWWMA